ncbi:MAG: type IX secretion system membrane protein PorP/SprF [Cytophagaceae bacterium]
MKIVKRIYLVVLIIFLAGSAAIAQQDAQFSQYMFNGLYYNPGYAGLEGVTRFSLIHRTQWLAYQSTQYGGGAPNSQIISASTPLPFLDKRTGAGIYIFNDKLGPLNNTEVQLSLSYHVKLGEGLLGIGARGGIYSQRVRTDYYQVVDEDDQIYRELTNNPRIRQTRPDMAGGLWYKHKKYYAGLSFNHLSRSKFNYGSPQINSKLENHFYFTAGYNFDFGPMLKLTPSALVQSDMNQWTYLFGALGTYNEKFWVGFNLRQSFAKRDVSQGGRTLSNDDIILYVGMNLLKNKQNMSPLRIGYAFDFVTSGVMAKKRTSHEILLSYIIPTPWEAPKPKVRTPRYRHEEN